MKLINTIYKLIICIIFSEANNIKTKINYLKDFYEKINFFKFIFFIFDKKTNPIKLKKFSEYIKLNSIKWDKFNIKINKDKKLILIENFVNQQSYTISNILVGKYLQIMNQSECIGLLRKGDIKGKILFQSFGINKFYIYNFGGFFLRLKYIFKAIKIINNFKNIKDYCNFKINNIDIGLPSYDSWIRYTGIPTTKEINFKLIIYFAQSLHANDFFESLLANLNISKLVQNERNFLPMNILFQKSLQKKIKIFTKLGFERVSVRIYNNFSQRYYTKNNFSKKLLNEIYKNNRYKAIKLSDEYYQYQVENKLYGKAWGLDIPNNKKIINLWKKKVKNIDLSNFDAKKKYLKIFYETNLKNISKEELCNEFNWDKKKKIVTVFLPYMIDGNFQNGRKNLYLDNYTWFVNTLKIIQNIKNVNWLIRAHPQEGRYNTKMDFPLMMEKIEEKFQHIKRSPELISPYDITKLTNIAVTCNGSCGVEYPSFGIPCLVAENSFYSHAGFSIKPKNISEYKNLLKKIHLIKKLNKKTTEKAKIFSFILTHLTKTRSTFLPDHMPNFETRMKINQEEEYWRYSILKLKKFNLKNDPFKKMFEKQIKFEHRHTINDKVMPIKY